MSDQENVIVNIEKNGVVIGHYLDSAAPRVQATHIKQMPTAQFRALITRAEWRLIYGAADADIDVKIFLDELATARGVDLARQDMIDDINHLADENLITADRATEILLGKPI